MTVVQKTCQCGATVSASSPIALKDALAAHDFAVHGIGCDPASPEIASVAVKFDAPTEQTNMNGEMLITQQEPFFILGFLADGTPGVLLNGQTVELTLDDNTIASVTEDAVPGTDPAGVQSIASGVARALKPGVQNLTATIRNADGSAGPAVTVPITVTAVEPPPPPDTGLASLKVSFGEPVEQVPA